VRRLLTVAGLGAALAAAAPAQAATVTLAGSKSCYRAGDTLTINGSGFTPNGQANITLEGRTLGTVGTDPVGNFSTPLTVGTLRGVSRRTVIATDAVDPANVGQAQFLGSALDVTVRPRNGAAGRKLRLEASGFTTGKRLYAHVFRKRYKRNLLLGKLKGPCRTLKVRKRVLPPGTPTGVYTVQFDTKRRYSKKTKVWVKFTVTVFPTAGGARVARAASVFGQPRLTQTVLFSR
jgi:hypothetical protein